MALAVSAGWIGRRQRYLDTSIMAPGLESLVIAEVRLLLSCVCSSTALRFWAPYVGVMNAEYPCSFGLIPEA